MISGYLTCCIVLLGGAAAFQRGGPMSLCYDPYPHHHVDRSQEASPYEILLDQTNYKPNDTIKVTVKGTIPFAGFQIAVHSMNGKWDTLYGEFLNHSSTVQGYNYYSSSKNCLTHSQKFVHTQSEEFYWQAPSENLGDLMFSATVVKNFNDFWVNRTAVIKAANFVNVSNIFSPSKIGAGSFDPDLALDKCGDKSGCVTYPPNCKEDSCKYVASYKTVSDGIRFRITNHEAKGENYIALGISKDVFMPEDETFTCSQEGDVVDLAHGYNPSMHNTKVQLAQDAMKDIAVSIIDAKLTCEFTRPFKGDFKYYGNTGLVTQNVDYSNGVSTAEYHLYVAWGERYIGSHSSVVKHHDLPAVSETKVAFDDKTRHSFSGLHINVKVHILFMTIAWAAMAGITMIVARYYKDGFLNATDKLCGLKPWFQVHRGMAFAIILLTAIAFVLIFIHYGEINQVLHAGFGIAVVTLTIIQIIAGLARPDGDAGKKRVVFNWVHRIGGVVTYLLAVATMATGTMIEYMGEMMHTTGFALVLALGHIPIVVLIILELVQCSKNKKDEKGVSPSPNTLNVQEKEPSKSSGASASHSLSFAIFICYVVVMVAILIAFIVMMWSV